MIRLLPSFMINQIAAGEVVERPSSALKELVENAIDAGATQIEITLIEGGKRLLTVSDNGKGMTPDELTLSVERHATSKLPTDDLFNINFLGFRGEALASIGAVAHLRISSKSAETDTGFCIEVNAGQKSDLMPVSQPQGTMVEVRDLFYNVPARLKFLKTDTSELLASKDIIYRIALAYPHVSFRLSDDKKQLLYFPAVKESKERARDVIDRHFVENTLDISAERDGMTLTGFIGIPTYTRATSADEYFIVNGRSIKNRMLFGLLKAAYQGLMFQGRFPISVLFLTVPQNEIDMNVHPAKTEVRFRDEASVRGFIIGSLKQTLSGAGIQTSTTLGIGALKTLAQNEHISPTSSFFPKEPKGHNIASSSFASNKTFFNDMPTDLSSFSDSCVENPHTYDEPSAPTAFKMPSKENELFGQSIDAFSVRADVTQDVETTENTSFPRLGFAKAQVHKTYILSQTEDSIIIVDQHAAHERLTYEKLKEAYETQIRSQLLLIPEIVELKDKEVDVLLRYAPDLKKMGLSYDVFGENAIMVREIPALLKQPDLPALMKDLAEILLETGTTFALNERIKDILASMACHGSVRAGRVLTLSEMNALLREMEEKQFTGECIHGRPTYIELKLKDFEKLFNRS